MRIVSTVPSLPVVAFHLAGEAYALPADQVLGALHQVAPRRVPGAGAWFDGVLSWRGRIVPVLNVARRLGLEGPAGEAAVLVECGGEVVALRVEAVDAEHPELLSALEPVSGPGGLVQAQGRLGDRPAWLLEPAALLACGPVSPFPVPSERPSRRPEGGRRGVKRA